MPAPMMRVCGGGEVIALGEEVDLGRLGLSGLALAGPLLGRCWRYCRICSA